MTNRCVLPILATAVLLSGAPGADAQTTRPAAPATDAQPADASRLRPAALTYRVTFRGQPMPDVTTELARDGQSWVARHISSTNTSEVRFGDDLRPRSSETKLLRDGESMGQSRIEYSAGRITGRSAMPDQMGGQRTFDLPAPAGVIPGGMDRHFLAGAALAPGKVLRVPVFEERRGRVEERTFTVVGEEQVVVPAGTFSTYRVEETGAAMPRTLYLQKAAPHLLVKMVVASDMVWELASRRGA